MRHCIEQDSTPENQAVHTLDYRPLNQPITAHMVPERYKLFLKLAYKDNFTQIAKTPVPYLQEHVHIPC